MTPNEVRGWLHGRQPAPPAALAARLEQVLAACPPEGLAAAASLTDALSLLGVGALDSLDGREATGDEVALDLLAADAFVTYAFEAAAREGRAAETVAAELLARATGGS